MTKEEAQKFLVNKKIFVKDKINEVLDKLVKLGFNWKDLWVATPLTDMPFLYLNENMRIGIGYSTKLFYEDGYEEISIEDILNIKTEESLPKTWDEYCKLTGYLESDSETNPQYRAHKRLFLLRNYYRNWGNPAKEAHNKKRVSYSIYLRKKDTPEILLNPMSPRFLIFMSENLTKEFLKNFKDLIIKAGDFI